MSMFIARVFGFTARSSGPVIENVVARTSSKAAAKGAQEVSAVLVESKPPHTSSFPKTKIVSYQEAEDLATKNFNERIQKISEERMAKENQGS